MKNKINEIPIKFIAIYHTYLVQQNSVISQSGLSGLLGVKKKAEVEIIVEPDSWCVPVIKVSRSIFCDLGLETGQFLIFLLFDVIVINFAICLSTTHN